MEVLALRLLALPVRLLPRRMALWIGSLVGGVAWWSRIRRKVVLSNLRQALPEASEAELVEVGRQAARNFGRTCSEFMRFAGRDRDRVGELVEIDGLDDLRAALAEGDGALLVTAHLGAWALYVGALAAAGIPSALLVGQQTNPHVDRLILGIPGDAVRFISKGKRAPRGILECLRDGLAVVMVADHYISSEAVWAPFLGRDASTLPLPGALLAKHGRPLFLMCGTRSQSGRHRVGIRRLQTPSNLEGDELRLAVATLCNRELGREILSNRDQYWWYHKRWKVRGGKSGSMKVLGHPPDAPRRRR